MIHGISVTIAQSSGAKRIIRILFGVILVSGLFYHLLHVKTWNEWVLSYHTLAPVIIVWPLVLALLFSIPNWFLESLKWRIGLLEVKPLTHSESFFSVLRGVTGASITPARIGEYAGRMYNMNTVEERWISITTTFVGSIAQNIVTLYIGCVGVFYLLTQYSDHMIYRNYALLTLSLVSLIALMGLFFNAEFVVRLILEQLPIPRWKEWAKMIRVINSKTKSAILIYSLLRYTVYVIQYLLIAYAYDIPVMSLTSISVIAAILCIQSLIPLPATISMIARAEIALWLWASIGAGELNILFTTYTLWAINIMLPALVGYTTVWSCRRSDTRTSRG